MSCFSSILNAFSSFCLDCSSEEENEEESEALIGLQAETMGIYNATLGRQNEIPPPYDARNALPRWNPIETCVIRSAMCSDETREEIDLVGLFRRTHHQICGMEVAVARLSAAEGGYIVDAGPKITQVLVQLDCIESISATVLPFLSIVETPPKPEAEITNLHLDPRFIISIRSFIPEVFAEKDIYPEHFWVRPSQNDISVFCKQTNGGERRIFSIKLFQDSRAESPIDQTLPTYSFLQCHGSSTSPYQGSSII